MSTSEFRVAVATKDDCLGVNFWPRCLVIPMSLPQNRTDLDQLCGRANRIEPNGIGYLGLLKELGLPITLLALSQSLMQKPLVQSEIGTQGKYLPLIDIH